MTIELKLMARTKPLVGYLKVPYHLIDNGVMVLEDKEGKTKNSSCKRKWVVQSCT